MKKQYNKINTRKLIIILIVVIIIAFVLLAVYVFKFLEKRNETFCKQFSYDNCPIEKCKVGGSCPVCADIGCHSKDYDKFWPKE